MSEIRQAILKQMHKSGLTINQVANLVKGKVPRRTVYAYLTGEENSLSKKASIIMKAMGLTITTTKKAKRPGRRRKR